MAPVTESAEYLTYCSHSAKEIVNMPIEYSFDPEAGIVSIVCSQNLTVDERIQSVDRVIDDPDLPELASVLIDVRKVKNAPTYNEIILIGLLIERLLVRFERRLSIVNSITTSHVTSSHLVSILVDKKYGEVRVFKSEDEARNWLKS